VLTNSMEQSPSEKLTVTQLVKKFPAFYRGSYRIHKMPPSSGFCVIFRNKHFFFTVSSY
jgi:hypothetical protein